MNKVGVVMSEEMKRCPFDDGKPEISVSRDGEVVNVRCENWGKTCLGAGDNAYTRQDAIRAWNRRAPAHADEPVAKEGMCDAVRGVLQSIRLNPGVTMDKVRLHCSMRGDNMRLWPEWANSMTSYVTEESAAKLIYEIMRAHPSAGIRSEVIEKARALVAKLDAIHGNEKYKSVWAVNQLHVGPYTGPQYTDELFALRKAIRALGESS